MPEVDNAIHDVERLWRQSTWIFKVRCSCGKVMTGTDEMDCGRLHDLHVLDQYIVVGRLPYW